jgi:hypothetical protein
MNCKNCPDREICFHFNILLDNNGNNFQNVKDAYLRTMRCRYKKFG